MGPLFYCYDAFISHAVEDKKSIANELFERLKKTTWLRIWYSGKKLGIGDSIEKTIYKGLRRSRYGIAIISPYYLNKNWTTQEFYSFLYKERDGDKVILPILHQVTLEEIVEKYPFMRDRYCVSSDRGMDYLVDVIIAEIKPRWIEDMLKMAGIALLTILLLFSAYHYVQRSYPPATVIEKEIKKRIETFQQNIETEYISQHEASGWKHSSLENVGTLFTAYKNLKAYYRNEYEFSNGNTPIRFKKYVQSALGLDPGLLTPFNAYQLSSPQVYLSIKNASGETKEATYALVNTQPAQFTITHSYPVDENTCVVTVTYENNIRYINVNLAFATGREGMKKQRMMLFGFLPEEKYTFEKNNEGNWRLESIE